MPGSMLNEALISAAMLRLGLNQANLADICSVSREAVSKWISGESIPRPANLRLLAQTLQTTVDQLVIRREEKQPVIAYRTRFREQVTGKAKARALEVGRHLRQLLPYIGGNRLFTPRVLENPSLDESYIRAAVEDIRLSLKLAATDSPSRAQLIDLLHEVGSIIVPVIWGQEKVGHENALSVYLPEVQKSWVVLNLAANQDDFKYWLAHELGHCLTLHKLRDQDGEDFAERFAQLLVFPDALAEQCLHAIRTSSDPLREALYFASRHEVSVVTVVKSADRLAVTRGEAATGIASEGFYEEWQKSRPNHPTVVMDLFGTDSPTAEEFISKTRDVFRTLVFSAIAKMQQAQGGRSPAFIASAFNIDLAQAVALSVAVDSDRV